MVNEKGIASYCQDCGLCALGRPENGGIQDETSLIDIIVNEVARTVGGTVPDQGDGSGNPRIPLGVSNRHLHITLETFRLLFGADAEIEKYRDLYQPGEFASKQTVTIAGSKMRAIQGVRILGPLRNYDQVELSLTDAVQLGINPPIRNSGDLKGAAPLTLIGPKQSVYVKECAIIASRHVHLPSDMAGTFGVDDGDFCKVRIGGMKGTVFENVLVRVNDAWKPHVHLDTDDANAANVRCDMSVEFYGKM